MIDAKEMWTGLAAPDAVAEEGFNKRIKVARPDITDDEIKKAFAAWLLEPRPPDAPGRPISQERFKRIFGRDATVEEQKRLRLR